MLRHLDWLKANQGLFLTFELLQQIGFQIGAPGNLQHLVNRRERDMMLQRVVVLNEETELLVQILKSKKRANTLVERVFVDGQGISPRINQKIFTDSD